MLSNDIFIKAARDYFYLISKEYPEKGIKKFVGDRYALSSEQRSALFRGLTDPEKAISRKKKIITEENAKNKALHIDLFNVLYTITSYFNGKLLFVCNDSILRDASETHGKRINEKKIDQAVSLIFDSLKSLKPLYVSFYLDKPVINSMIILKKIKTKLSEYKYAGEAEVFDSADDILKKIREGILITSDSTIIARSNTVVFDLARYILHNQYNTDFFDFNLIISYLCLK